MVAPTLQAFLPYVRSQFLFVYTYQCVFLCMGVVPATGFTAPYIIPRALALHFTDYGQHITTYVHFAEARGIHYSGDVNGHQLRVYWCD
jgi:hypothetical protein